MNIQQFFNEARSVRLWWGAMAVLFALTCLLAPIRDPDFFWHLRTGQWIWENHALPAVDPFTTSWETPIENRQYFILTSYWLAQLIYYLTHLVSGWAGFFVLRLLLMVLLVRTLQARDCHWPFGHAVLSSAFLFILFARFPVERPQFFTFLMFSAALVLLHPLISAREGDRPPLSATIGLPALLLLWANLHGGIVLGQILCLAYWLNSGLTCLCGGISRKFFGRISLVLLVSLACSLVNPNGATFILAQKEFLDPKYQVFFDSNREFMSLYSAIFAGKDWFCLLFPLLALLAVYGLLRDGFRKNLMLIGLLCCFGFFAFRHLRYAPFLAILALPFAANALARMKRSAATVVVLVLFAAALIGVRDQFSNLKWLLAGGPVSVQYPARAVEFVKQSGLKGNLLGEFKWGGYLGWALGPGHNVFVDGRTLNDERYRDYLLMTQLLDLAGERADEHIDQYGKGKILDHLLQKYRIDYMILPKIWWGKPFWLAVTIADHPGWNAVYADPLAVVFVRKKPEKFQGRSI